MKIILVALLCIPGFMQAQRWHVNLSGGVSNYSGDLKGKSYTPEQSNFAFSGGVQYDFTEHFSLTSNLSVMKVGASDAYNNPNLVFRNLSFQSQVVEGNLLAEYTLFDLSQTKFSPFIFAGVAVFHFNPYAYDSTGTKVYLKPLSTEGEGLPEYPDRKPYNLTQFAIPFGGGIKFRVSDRVVLAYEIGFRKTYTDYLDDVSSKYVDMAVLGAAKGPKAVEMAYRAGELKGGNRSFPTPGTVRGRQSNNDWYYYNGIRVSIALGSGNNGLYNRSRIDCPPAVQ